MSKNPSYTALLGPTCLLISGKSATYVHDYMVLHDYLAGYSIIIDSFPQFMRHDKQLHIKIISLVSK